MPCGRNRSRETLLGAGVDQAVAFYLRCVAEALWHLEPFRPVYQMYLHRISAEQATAILESQPAIWFVFVLKMP